MQVAQVASTGQRAWWSAKWIFRHCILVVQFPNSSPIAHTRKKFSLKTFWRNSITYPVEIKIELWSLKNQQLSYIQTRSTLTPMCLQMNSFCELLCVHKNHLLFHPPNWPMFVTLPINFLWISFNHSRQVRISLSDSSIAICEANWIHLLIFQTPSSILS